MKNTLLVVNIILLFLVGILFYWHFSDCKKTCSNTVATNNKAVNATSHKSSGIAYFDMDSLQEKYVYFKESLNKLKAQEQNIANELSGKEKAFQQRMATLQNQSKTMTQQQGEAAQKELAEMNQAYQVRKQELSESYSKQTMEFKKNIKKKIDAYIKEYNKDGKFAYIFSFEPEFMYYGDSTLNITNEVIKGLNAAKIKETK